jgi:DNA-binding response OmpR family regulator
MSRRSDRLPDPPFPGVDVPGLKSTARRSVMPTPRRRLLLVEDARLVREVLSESLTQADFHVDTAGTATEAMEWLSIRRYAAIVADGILPDLSPMDWLAAIRGAAPETPIVLYSGTVALEDLQQLARQWEVAAVLEKPFTPAELVVAVRVAIQPVPNGEGRT